MDQGEQGVLFDLAAGMREGWTWTRSRDEFARGVADALAAPPSPALGDRVVAIDLETGGLDPIKHPIRAIAWSCGDRAWFADWFVALEAEDALDRLLAGEEAAAAFHNAKFDLRFLREKGAIEALPARLHDTMILAHLAVPEAPGFGLADLCRHLLGEEHGSKVQHPEKAAVGELFAHACGDVWRTRQLLEILWGRLVRPLPNRWTPDGGAVLTKKTVDQRALYATEVALLRELVGMEERGCAVDVAELDKLSAELTGRVSALRAEAHALAGGPFNDRSRRELRRALEAAGGAVGAKLDEAALQAMRIPLADKVLELRGAEKLLKTYVDSFRERAHGGRLHCDFRQCGTETGRLACAQPNLQNVPATDLRRVFCTPDPERVEIVVVDFQQIEMRIFAHYSEEPSLLDAFARGVDVHATTGALMFGVALEAVTKEQRAIAKRINFGLLFGAGVKRLALLLGCPEARARQLYAAYFRAYPRVRALRDAMARAVEQRAHARVRGWIESYFGRVRYLDSPHKALNTVIQGTAGDFFKGRIVALGELLRGKRTAMVLNVHDEIVFEHWKEENLVDAIVRTMEDPSTFRVPLTCSVGRGASWHEAK